MQITTEVLRNTRGKDWHPGCKILNSERGIAKAVKRITRVMAPGVCIDSSLSI